MNEIPDDQDHEVSDSFGATPRESIPLDIRESCADAFRAAVPRLRMIACGEDECATVHHALVAASLLARYAVANPRHVLLGDRDFAEIATRAVYDAFHPTESQFEDFLSALGDRLREREDGLNSGLHP